MPVSASVYRSFRYSTRPSFSLKRSCQGMWAVSVAVMYLHLVAELAQSIADADAFFRGQFRQRLADRASGNAEHAERFLARSHVAGIVFKIAVQNLRPLVGTQRRLVVPGAERSVNGRHLAGNYARRS